MHIIVLMVVTGTAGESQFVKPRDRSRETRFGIGGKDSKEIRHLAIDSTELFDHIEIISKFVRKM